MQVDTKNIWTVLVTAMTVLGGSTNAVLHFLAIARAAQIEFTLDDFQRISDTTPFLADLKPSGQYLMEDVHAIGGIPSVLKYLHQQGLMHGDSLTVTGKTIAENLAEAQDLPAQEGHQGEPRQAVRVRRRRGERQGEDAREGGLARREQEHRVPHRVHARQGVSFVGVC